MDLAAQTAHRAATFGAFVFPIKPNSKHPFSKFKWRELSSNNPEQVEAWAAQHPGCNWALDCGKSGIVAVDVDVKHDGAMDRLMDLEIAFSLPKTHTVRTPSGGLHLYFRGVAQNSTSKLALGIDTRGEGGYVLLPGSSIGGKLYEVISGSQPVAQLPEELAAAIGAPAPKAEAPLPSPVDADQAHNIAAFTELLLHAEPVPEGRRNHETYVMAAQGRDLGLSLELVQALMLAHWLPKLDGGFSSAELTKTVDSVYKTAKNAPGCATVEALFPEEEFEGGFTVGAQPGPEPVPDEKWSWSAADVIGKKIPPRQWVLGTRCIKGFVDVLVAPGGTSKSTFLLAECMSIVSGIPLTGEPIHRPGPCLIVNGEDPTDEMERRVQAAVKHYGLEPENVSQLRLRSEYGQDDPPHLVNRDKNGRPRINYAYVNEIIRRGRGCVRIVIDPLVRFHCMNENDNTEMDLVMRVLTEIASKTGAAVSVAHHTNKGKGQSGDEGNGDATRARGAGAIIAAARIAHTMGVMGPKEAKKCGIKENQRQWFVRIDDAKGNLAPPAHEAKWYQRVSVEMEEDHVGVLQPMDLGYVDELEGDELTLAQAALDALLALDAGEASVYEVAKELAGNRGMYPEIPDMGMKSMQRALAEIFEVEREVAGRKVWAFEKKSKGRQALYLRVEN